jgi:tetraacyldisaccharide 4'-kinase
VFVSTTTLAGREMAARKFAGKAEGVFYAPLDMVWTVRRVLRLLQPAVVVVMETEIWPNLFHETSRTGARLVVVNGRISDKALPAYQRWAWFFRAVLPEAAAVLAQDETAASRYRELGAPAVEDAGNLKYDFDPGSARVAADLASFLERIPAETTWIAASTMPPELPMDPDEDVVVLDAFEDLARRHRKQLMILVPRRPERFEPAARLLDERGIAWQRRSALTPESTLTLPGVLLVDTIGELSGLFSRADVVFMGGTLVHRGGHNILEPAAFGCAMVTGPHMENFAEIAASFREAGAVVTAPGPESLAGALEPLLVDSAARRELGAKALEQAGRRRGATARAAGRIVDLFEQATPKPPGTNPLAFLWRAGTALDRALSRRRRLGPPVISIGNLAMGGTGKTPMVLWLAEKLTLEGLRVAVLTRGYGRSSRKPIALPAGARAPVSETGEEPQLLLRSGLMPVGIARNRAKIGEQMAREVRPDVFLLDDGFQHWALERDLDIVLVDSLDPWRGGLPPAGRLREEPGALARAQAVVLTRTEPHRTYAGLLDQITRANPVAQVFRATVEPGRVPFAPGEKICAFCGLAQPETFRATLRALGCEPVLFKVFPDHHKYSEVELTGLAALAPKLVTTEKDLLNVPERLRGALPIVAVPVRMRVENGERLLELVLAAVKSRGNCANFKKSGGL